MLDIIVPVYNEGENIRDLFDQIVSDIKTEKRILIVYDFEEDNTLPEVNKAIQEMPLNIEAIRNIYGRGALNAIKTGLHESTANAVLVTMADLADSLTSVDKMYELVEQGYDLVCGSRYMKVGKQIGGPLLKRTLSRIAGVSLRYLTRIPTHDVTNSFKMYTRKVLDLFEIESSGGFELGMELTVKSYVHGLKITETPATWYDRTAGKSNFKLWSWLPRYLYWYFYGILHIWFSGKASTV